MLIRFGLNRKQAVIAILALCVFMSLAGILGTVFRVPEYFMFLIFLAYFFIHLQLFTTWSLAGCTPGGAGTGFYRKVAAQGRPGNESCRPLFRARDPRLHEDVANYWLMRSKTLDPVSDSWEAALEKVCVHYRLALDLERGKKRETLLENIRKTVWTYYPDEEIFEKIVR